MHYDANLSTIQVEVQVQSESLFSLEVSKRNRTNDRNNKARLHEIVAFTTSVDRQ